MLSGAGPGRSLAHLQVPGPGVDRIGRERAALHRHLDAVVQADRQLAGHPRADGRLRQVANGGQLAAQVDVAPPEQEWLDGCFRYQLPGRGVDARKTIAVTALVELVWQASYE